MSRTLLFAILIILPAISQAMCVANKPEKFSTFFQQFATNKKFAVSRTRYPLKVVTWGYGVDAQGKDASTTSLSYLSELEDGKLDSLSVELKKNNMQATILSVQKNLAIVHEFAEGTDWGYKLHFSRNGNCWYYTELEDVSL